LRAVLDTKTEGKVRYRAILRNVPGLERPKQNFANATGNLYKWASEILITSPEGAYVEIEEMKYFPVKTLTREDAERILDAEKAAVAAGKPTPCLGA
jgi:hypothetical protein